MRETAPLAAVLSGRVADEGSDDPPTVPDIAARALIALLPANVRESLSIVYTGFRERRATYAAEVLASAIGDLDPGEFSERLQANEEIEALVATAVEVGVRTALEQKRRLLGRVINRAVLDDAQIDHAQLLVGVLAQIDAPHIRCLEAVHRLEDVARSEREVPARSPGAGRPIIPRITEAGPQYPAPVFVLLVSLGLLDASNMETGVTLVKGVTEFGEQLLKDLREAPVA